jgi:hypothetical protein
VEVKAMTASACSGASVMEVADAESGMVYS